MMEASQPLPIPKDFDEFESWPKVQHDERIQFRMKFSDDLEQVRFKEISDCKSEDINEVTKRIQQHYKTHLAEWEYYNHESRLWGCWSFRMEREVHKLKDVPSAQFSAESQKVRDMINGIESPGDRDWERDILHSRRCVQIKESIANLSKMTTQIQLMNAESHISAMIGTTDSALLELLGNAYAVNKERINYQSTYTGSAVYAVRGWLSSKK